MRIRLVLVDLDNTLSDWVRFFVPSMQAMVREICRQLAVDEAAIVAELKVVYAQHASVEYSFCVQAIPSVARLPPDQRRRLVQSCRESFGEARDRNLVAYAGVCDTIRRLYEEGIMVVGTTNAPMYQAIRRLERLGVAPSFAGIAARRSFEAPAGDSIANVLTVRRRATYQPIKRLWCFDPADLKPSERMYEAALSGTGTDPGAALAVGDHVANDIAPALRLGIRAAWARYGAAVDPNLWRELLAVTPWSTTAVTRRAESPPAGLPALESFDEILAMI